jgi:hypothetical protein
MEGAVRIDRNARCVYLITSKDGGVLFDLDNDEFWKLDPIASNMWSLLCAGKSESDIVTTLSTLCDVDPGRVAKDLESLLQSAEKRKITPEYVQISEGSKPSIQEHKHYPYYGQGLDQARPRPSRLRVCHAFLFLAAFDLALSIGSLKTLCLRVRRWPLRQPRRGDAEMIGRICTAVERACVWYPKKAVCLQRSAVTVCLLKSVGIDARMIVGARVMPMLSHAWVEVNGEVVNDYLKVTTVYQSVASF